MRAHTPPERFPSLRANIDRPPHPEPQLAELKWARAEACFGRKAANPNALLQKLGAAPPSSILHTQAQDRV